MRILDRYLIKGFFHSLFLSVVCLLGIYVIVEFFEKIDDVVKRGIASIIMLKYLFYSLPKIFFQILPVAFLIAVLLILGLMSRNGELMAIKASGISLYRVTSVLLAIALIFSVVTFICQEVILPGSNQAASYYKKIINGKKPGKNLRQNRIWFWGSGNRVFNIQFMDAKRQEARGVTFFKLDSQFHIVHRVDAKRAVYRHDKWYLYNGVERFFSGDNFKKVTFQEFERKHFTIPEGFEDIFAMQKQPEEMTYQELSKYIERLQGAGYRADKYLVDLYTKISMPFIIFIMTLIGVSFAVKIDKSARLFNVGLGLLISFICWIISTVGISLGHIGLFPPIVAAWLGNVIFLLLGAYLFVTIST